MKNWAGVEFTEKEGLATTPGDTYDGGQCKCGHSAMAHRVQGHITSGFWDCRNGEVVLGCGWHKFEHISGGV